MICLFPPKEFRNCKVLMFESGNGASDYVQSESETSFHLKWKISNSEVSIAKCKFSVNSKWTISSVIMNLCLVAMVHHSYSFSALLFTSNHLVFKMSVADGKKFSVWLHISLSSSDKEELLSDSYQRLKKKQGIGTHDDSWEQALIIVVMHTCFF